MRKQSFENATWRLAYLQDSLTAHKPSAADTTQCIWMRSLEDDARADLKHVKAEIRELQKQGDKACAPTPVCCIEGSKAEIHRCVSMHCHRRDRRPLQESEHPDRVRCRGRACPLTSA